jgi:hypothetical protein
LHAAWSNGAAFLLCQITAIAYDSTEPEVLWNLFNWEYRAPSTFLPQPLLVVLKFEYPHRLHPLLGPLVDIIGFNFYYILIDGFDTLVIHTKLRTDESATANC